MLTPEQTYYLQTMGIEPWVSRASMPDARVTVVVTDILDDASKQLLYCMMRSIDLSDHDICIKDNLNADDIKQQVSKIKSGAVMVLGHTTGACLLGEGLAFENMREQTHAHVEQSLVVTYHPRELLEKPIYKKQAYADLALLKKGGTIR